MNVPFSGKQSKKKIKSTCNISGESRRQAYKVLSLRRAILMALVSTQSQHGKEDMSTSSFVHLSKQFIELKALKLKAELDICDLLLRMNRNEKLHTVFDCFDKDGSGTIDVEELAEGIRILRMLPALAGVSDMVDEFRDHFYQVHSDKGRFLDVEEFGLLLEGLAQVFGCLMDDLYTLVLTQMCFSQDGVSFLQESVATMIQGTEGKNVSVDEAISEVRLVILFDLLDTDGSGQLMFSTVLKHLVKTTNVLDDMYYDALKSSMSQPSRTMDYFQFADLLLNLSRAFSDCDLHHICDQMTLSKCHYEEDIRNIFLKDRAFEDAKLIAHVPASCSNMEERVGRLFTLWDHNSDGKLDAREFALGLRLFQESKHIDHTISESMNVLFAFDQDGDNQLDRSEFCVMLQKFSIANGVDLWELIDFMVVNSAMNDVKAKESAYITSLLTCQGTIPRADLQQEQIPGKLHRNRFSDFFRQSSLKALTHKFTSPSV